MSRAVTNLDLEARELAAYLKIVRAGLDAPDHSTEDHALCAIETFIDIALRVLRKVNPSKIRDEARTVETKARLDGTPIIEMSNVQVIKPGASPQPEGESP